MVQVETQYTPEPTQIIYGITPPRFPILVPDDDDFPHPRVPFHEQMVNIQPFQDTIHHQNRNQIL